MGGASSTASASAAASAAKPAMSSAALAAKPAMTPKPVMNAMANSAGRALAGNAAQQTPATTPRSVMNAMANSAGKALAANQAPGLKTARPAARPPANPGNSADQQQKNSWRETLGKTVQDASSSIAQAFANQQAPTFSPVIASSPVLDEAANISAPAFPGATRFASDLVRNQALNEAMAQTGRLAGAGSQGYRF